MRFIAAVAAVMLLAVQAEADSALTVIDKDTKQHGPQPTSAQNKAYLDSNAQKAGVVVLPGIQYRVLKAGTGAMPERHDCVSVYYKGSLVDGTMFDQQAAPAEPISFPVNGVIGGWTEALQMMRVGSKWEVTIPPGLAYGRLGTGDGTIAGDQTLVFEIELLRVYKPTATGCDQ